jgi:hypothetical protein
MKTQKTILATLAIVLASTFSFAQTSNNNAEVRVLPHNESGIMRLLYSGDNKELVTVKFYSGNALLYKDKVQADKYEKGFIKHYDLRKLGTGDFKVVVETSGKSTGYAFNVDRENKIWAEYWNNYTSKDSNIAKLEKEDKALLVSGN